MLFNKRSYKRLPNNTQSNRSCNRQPGNRQQGFVLILALVMLSVLTLIGVSSMDGASMELRATANAQQHQVAFVAVQSLLEFSVSNGTTVDYQPADLTAEQTIAYTFPDASSLSATVSYAGCFVGIGSSLAGGGFSYNFFNIAGSGANAAGSARSSQSQGIRYPSASCDPLLTP